MRIVVAGQIGRKRANALDTAAPSERSDLRKMKRAAARESSKREKQNTPHQVRVVAMVVHSDAVLTASSVVCLFTGGGCGRRWWRG